MSKFIDYLIMTFVGLTVEVVVPVVLVGSPIALGIYLGSMGHILGFSGNLQFLLVLLAVFLGYVLTISILMMVDDWKNQ